MADEKLSGDLRLIEAIIEYDKRFCKRVYYKKNKRAYKWVYKKSTTPEQVFEFFQQYITGEK